MTTTTQTPLTIDGFEQHRLPGAGDTLLNVAVGGDGPPVVLLHGFPQTHAMWRLVGPDLATDHTVIAPDLRGYGASDKPAEADEDTYSKRTMGADVVAAVSALGHDAFSLVGHDRGALVAVRTALDHADVVRHLGILDVLPTMDMWDVLHGVDAKVAWHLYLMAQPAPLPERMIAAVAEEFFDSFLSAWDPDGATFPAAVREAYVASSVASTDAIVADYRASAGIDLAMDREDRAAGRTLSMPVGVLSQDWGAQLGFDAAGLWRAWSPDLTYEPIDAGHFMAEEQPARVAAFVRGLVAR